MFKFNIRNLIIFFVLIAAILIFFYQKDQNWFKQWQKEGIGSQNVSNKNEQQIEKRNSVVLTRDSVMNYISKNIVKLSPTEPSSGAKWGVSRFWFATNRDLYVEYDDGRIFRQILVSIEGQYEPLDYKIIGYFEASDNGWKLKVGEDTMFGRKLDLYEFDAVSAKWVKKN